MVTFKWDEILIVGDSFAGNQHNPKSWTNQLLNKLTKNTNLNPDGTMIKAPRGEGYPGCSWWSVRKKLLAELKIKIPKILIICHTEQNRIPSDINLPLNSGSVQDLKKHVWFDSKLSKCDYDSVGKAGILFYKHLISEDFNMWAQWRWFSELDAVTKFYNIPYVIHMNCFPSDLAEYKFENGLIVEEILWINSTGYKLWKEDSHTFSKININLINHFNLAENKLLANCLYDAINSYSMGKRKIGFVT